jgi:DNA-binding transcriptional LysR family regulator
MSLPIGYFMNWNDLRVFLAIAHSGSLSGAARILGNNHSTIFRRLGELEKSLNVRLFERLPGGYVLTTAGERALVLAREAETAIDRIHLELAGRELTAAGKVRVTTAPNLARTILPIAVKKLRKSHPAIAVEIAVGDSDYDLNRREADIALRATTSPPENLVGKQLRELPWWVCCGARFPDKPKNLKHLDQLPLIGADFAMLRLPVFQWLEDNYQSQIVARANDLVTMSALTREGVGVSLLPADLQEAGVRQQFQLPDRVGQLWLLTHPDLRFSPRIRAVWEAIEFATAERP